MFYVNARAFIERRINETTEIVIQTRNKKNEQALELPGGRLEMYEPILEALKREVFEETGLTVVTVEGSESRIDTCGINPHFEVECLRPFAVYQTVRGPVDSTGYYFLCTAEGELLGAGDETTGIRWIAVDELAGLMAEDPLQFSDVDRAGIRFYLKEASR